MPSPSCGTQVLMDHEGDTHIGSGLYINRGGGNEGSIKSEHLTLAGNLMTDHVCNPTGKYQFSKELR